MTEMKHTPTPWLVQHEFDNEPSYIVDEQDVTVAVCHSQPLDDWPAYENAKFIVRAVNAHDAMLEALQLAIRSRWLSIDNEHNRTREACDIRSAICAAIDKATGAQ